MRVELSLGISDDTNNSLYLFLFSFLCMKRQITLSLCDESASRVCQRMSVDRQAHSLPTPRLLGPRYIVQAPRSSAYLRDE